MIIILLCAILIQITFEHVTAEHASTWDYCNCRWDPWSAWSQCSKSCGGGIQERNRKVWSKDIPECDSFENCATPGSGWDRRACNTHCEHGGTFHQLGTFGFCSCPKGLKGSCCEQIVNCGQPSFVSNGFFTGNDFTYNHQVKYTCNNKYNMSDPSKASRTCTENGYWSGRTPVCLYAVSCDSSPCKNSATCVNLLGDYLCKCRQGWSGKNCDVDIQPPVVTGCPQDRRILTSNITSKQTWSEPNIADPLGKEVRITKNYQKNSFEFPWGVYTIQYSAVKPSNGLTAECIFNISVKPYPCKKMDPPTNGIIACNNWRTEYVQVCKFLCKKGYSLPPGHKKEDIYNCGASGNWLPQTSVFECVPDDLFSGNLGYLNENTTISTCKTAADIQDISRFYISALKRSPLNELCLNYAADCNPKNVDIRC